MMNILEADVFRANFALDSGLPKSTRSVLGIKSPDNEMTIADRPHC
jgi:hypothetical protein